MSGLNRRILMASGLLAVIVGATFCVLLVSIVRMERADAHARHAVAELDTVSRFQIMLDDIQSSQRGYIVTREKQLLQPWKAAVASLPRQEHALIGTAGDPQQMAMVRHIIEGTNAYIRDYAVPVVATARVDPSAARTLLERSGKPRDALRAEFGPLVKSDRAQAVSEQRAAATDGKWAFSAAVGGLAGSFLFVVLVAGYLTKAISRPIREAAVMAGRLAGGDLSVRIPEAAVGEVGALQRTFNAMAGSLQRRQSEQAALRRVATLVAHGPPAPAIFTAVTDEVRRVLDAAGARMLRYEPDCSATVVARSDAPGLELPHPTWWNLAGDNVPALVLHTGRPARMDDFTNASGPLAAFLRRYGFRCQVGAPIVVQDQLWGAMLGFSMRQEPLPDDAEARLSDFTELVATAIANANARAELNASRARIVAASDDTRRRIERDLHDGIQQRLVLLGLELRTAEEELPAELAHLRTRMGKVVTGLGEALADLRETSRGIHPAILTQGGLGPAIKALARRSPIPVELDIRIGERLPQNIEGAAYYVVAEALTNAAKHARATVAHIEAEIQAQHLHLSVRDNGAGGADPKSGSGLIGLVDRVEATGGTMTISSPPRKGTSLRIDLPIDTPQRTAP